MSNTITQPEANPYRIEGPAIISFSGGRTSAYMLKQILNAHGGRLLSDVVVTFANTGKERIETLDFVRDCETAWRVPIYWLEYDPTGEVGRRYRQVTHQTASRDGEPFEALLRSKKYLPNPVTRMCTADLKVRVMRDFARKIGWDHWTNVIGLRADEPGRVGKALCPDQQRRNRWVAACPLATAGATEDMILDWWKTQPFDLGLKSYEGNCDLCFLKGAKKISRIMRDRPDLAQWWIDAERMHCTKAGNGARFRSDRPSYAQMLDAVERQDEFDFGIFDDAQSCGFTCTD